MQIKKIAAQLYKLLNIPKKLQLALMHIVNDEFLIGVTGVVLNKKNEVLLLKHAYRQTSWSLPGGYLKKGEYPQKGLEREVWEESKLKVKMEKIIKAWYDPASARVDISCMGKFHSGKFSPSTEINDYGFFAYRDLPTIGKEQRELITNALQEEKSLEIKHHGFFDRLLVSLRITKQRLQSFTAILRRFYTQGFQGVIK